MRILYRKNLSNEGNSPTWLGWYDSLRVRQHIRFWYLYKVTTPANQWLIDHSWTHRFWGIWDAIPEYRSGACFILRAHYTEIHDQSTKDNLVYYCEWCGSSRTEKQYRNRKVYKRGMDNLFVE